MNAYSKYIDKISKQMNLLLNDQEILKRYSEIWNKIKNLIKKKCNIIPKDNEYCSCLSVILSDSIFVNSDKEFYPQIFLEECKYAIKNIKQ